MHQQGEIDLLIENKGKLDAYEFKYNSSPSISKSITLALDSLPIDKVTIIAPVDAGYKLAENIYVESIASLA